MDASGFSYRFRYVKKNLHLLHFGISTVFVRFILRLLHSSSSTRHHRRLVASSSSASALDIIDLFVCERWHSTSSISSSANVDTRHRLFVCERRHSTSSRLHSASASSLRLQTQRRHHLRMTSFSVDETLNQSCSSPVLGKRKPIKPPSSVCEHFIKVEGCDPKYPRAACKHCGASYACDSKRNANHKGDTISRAIEKCLEGWGIDRLFTVTVDNASSNDVTIAYLVKKFKGKNGLVLDGEFIHIRCCAHILNLIVSDALKDLHVSIIRIRNAVKYVRSSPTRLQIFKDFAKEDKMSTKNCLTMDVPTRWNSTFTMLDGAIKCQKTFERLEVYDPSYLPKDDIPTTEDWDNAKVFVKFLKTFSETKFNKYWGITTSEKTNLLLYVSVVLDPRGSYKARATVHDRFKQSNKTCLDDVKTEVTCYLDEARIDCMGDEYLDLLTWWKVNSSRFKIISQVARDIYSIPISTVPSESAFSTGGRVLDSFRSSLTPQIAESLICAQNWIQSKPLDDMTEEIDGADEIDEEFINIGKEMEATFENLNNDSMV
ncbi:putative transposase [Cucumis melo var. makuwa]|uniref:Putative transposase n=1 Tax=Cucumis melo var. makuwa TaxID=1194695 RepID=A0A5D3DF72_CUCMM|nr:putative transposase [Cucumis melo var. makuwa]